MSGVSGPLLLVEPCHMSVIKLTDPFGKNGGSIGAWNIKTRGPPGIGLIPFWAFWEGDFIVLNVML